MLTRSLLMIMGIFALPVIPAFATDTFTFRTDAANYVVAPNQTVPVTLFLQETKTTGSFFWTLKAAFFQPEFEGR